MKQTQITASADEHILTVDTDSRKELQAEVSWAQQVLLEPALLLARWKHRQKQCILSLLADHTRSHMPRYGLVVFQLLEELLLETSGAVIRLLKRHTTPTHRAQSAKLKLQTPWGETAQAQHRDHHQALLILLT